MKIYVKMTDMLEYWKNITNIFFQDGHIKIKKNL